MRIFTAVMASLTIIIFPIALYLASNDEAFASNDNQGAMISPGIYRGDYICAQGKTSADLVIYESSAGKRGRFYFQRGYISGSYEVEILKDNQDFILKPTAWISQPRGYSAIPIRVKMTDNRLDGVIEARGCGVINLVRDKGVNQTVLAEIQPVFDDRPDSNSVSMDDYRKLLDDTVALDAAYWFSNRFQKNSVRNIVVGQTNGMQSIRGEFSYSRGGPSGNQIAWVEGNISGNRITCLRYWDSADRCVEPRGGPRPYLETTAKTPLTPSELANTVNAYGVYLISNNSPAVQGSMILEQTPDRNGRVFGTWLYEDGVKPTGEPVRWKQRFYIERLASGKICLRENADEGRPCANLSLTLAEAKQRQSAIVQREESERRQALADRAARKPGASLNDQDVACLEPITEKFYTTERGRCLAYSTLASGSQGCDRYESVDAPNYRYKLKNICKRQVSFQEYCGSTPFGYAKLQPGEVYTRQFVSPCRIAY